MAVRPKGAMGVHCWLLKAISENASLAAAGGGAEKAIGTSGHKEALARSSALITSSSFDSTLSPDVFPPLSLWLLPFFLSLSTPLLEPEFPPILSLKLCIGLVSFIGKAENE